MTTEAILMLSSYLAPVALPIIVDVTGDLLPIKYVGKIRKLFRHARKIQGNKGRAARNIEAWSEVDYQLAKIQQKVLSEPFEKMVAELRITIDALIMTTDALGDAGVLQKEALNQYIALFTQQTGVAQKFQDMFNEILTDNNQKEGT